MEEPKFKQEMDRITKRYNISEGEAACYLSNDGRDKYICKTHNGGCKELTRCQERSKREKQK